MSRAPIAERTLIGEKRILWRAENEKIGMKHSPPLSGEAARVLEQSRRKRESIRDGWLLPSPENSSKPCSRHLLRSWWRRTEKLAGVPHTARLGWHRLRRKFVNDMKADTPMADPHAYQAGSYEHEIGSEVLTSLRSRTSCSACRASKNILRTSANILRIRMDTATDTISPSIGDDSGKSRSAKVTIAQIMG